MHSIKSLIEIGAWRSVSIALLLGYASFANGAPTNLVVTPTPDTVEFTAVGKPGFLKINGKKAAVKGSATHDGASVTGKFEVALNEFETGIETRDEHMKDKYLETKKFPIATLEVKNIEVPNKGASDVNFKGDLTLHGVTKPISGLAKVKWTNGGKDVEVEGKFEITLSDFKIDIPQYLGVKVADTVNIATNFTAHQK